MTLNEIIQNTRKEERESYERLLQSRISGEDGSIYLDVKDTRTLDLLLRTANWEETLHLDLPPETHAYVTRDIPGGHTGVAELSELPENAELTVEGPDENGEIYLSISDDLGPADQETWAIIGPAEEGGLYNEPVLKSFQPGEPKEATAIHDTHLSPGDKLTKTEAIALGFDRALIILNERIREIVREMQERTFGLEQLPEQERTPQICMATVERNGLQLQYVPDQTPEICQKAVGQNPWALEFVQDKSPEICMTAVKQHGSALYFIREQEPACCMEAVSHYGAALEYVRDQSPELCLAAVRQDGLALEYVKEQTPEICLAAVKQNGMALPYVHEQSPEICLEAVRSDGFALEFVKEQTPEIAMAAVIQNSNALHYVLEPTQELYMEAVKKDGFVLRDIDPTARTPELCLEAVKQDGMALRYVEEQTPEICLAAVEQRPEAIQYVREQTPEVALAVVRQDGTFLELIKEQTPEICLAAVEQNGWALAYVKEQTPEIALTAVRENPEVITYVETVTPEIAAVAKDPDNHGKHDILFDRGVSELLAEMERLEREEPAISDSLGERADDIRGLIKNAEEKIERDTLTKRNNDVPDLDEQGR